MLIGIAMALDTVVKVADSFLDMLAANFLQRMLMATVAGVGAVVVAHVAGYTFHVVVAIQLEILRMIKGRRGPFVLAVTFAAIAGDLLMQAVFGRLVAALTFCAGCLIQQAMIEPSGWPEPLYPGVITVAGNAIRADELLVERCRCKGFLDR